MHASILKDKLLESKKLHQLFYKIGITLNQQKIGKGDISITRIDLNSMKITEIDYTYHIMDRYNKNVRDKIRNKELNKQMITLANKLLQNDIIKQNANIYEKSK